MSSLGLVRFLVNAEPRAAVQSQFGLQDIFQSMVATFFVASSACQQQPEELACHGDREVQVTKIHTFDSNGSKEAFLGIPGLDKEEAEKILDGWRSLYVLYSEFWRSWNQKTKVLKLDMESTQIVRLVIYLYNTDGHFRFKWDRAGKPRLPEGIVFREELVAEVKHFLRVLDRMFCINLSKELSKEALSAKRESPSSTGVIDTLLAHLSALDGGGHSETNSGYLLQKESRRSLVSMLQDLAAACGNLQQVLQPAGAPEKSKTAFSRDKSGKVSGKLASVVPAPAIPSSSLFASSLPTRLRSVLPARKKRSEEVTALIGSSTSSELEESVEDELEKVALSEKVEGCQRSWDEALNELAETYPAFKEVVTRQTDRESSFLNGLHAAKSLLDDRVKDLTVELLPRLRELLFCLKHNHVPKLWSFYGERMMTFGYGIEGWPVGPTPFKKLTPNQQRCGKGEDNQLTVNDNTL